MGVDYAWEKFFTSLHYAVAGSDSLQSRLASVIMGVHHLGADSFPADGEIWEEFQVLKRETTKLQARGNEGTIQATTSQMTDDEAAKWLRVAFGIFSDIAKAYGRS
jgi:hypothetical protein